MADEFEEYYRKAYEEELKADDATSIDSKNLTAPLGFDPLSPEVAREAARFAVVVGHEKIAPGAYAGPPINTHEYPWNTHLARLIFDETRARRIPCAVFFRDGHGIAGAYRQAMQWGATSIVELHFNAVDRPDATGTETLLARRNAQGYADRQQALMCSALGLHNRGLKVIEPGGRGYRSLTAAPVPTILIEPFFGTNPNDCRIAAACKHDLALAVVEAFGTVMV